MADAAKTLKRFSCRHCLLSIFSALYPHTVKVVVAQWKLILLTWYFILWSRIFVFVIHQYDLMAGVNFSLIGKDPKVSHLLAVIDMSIADVIKDIQVWVGGLTNNLVDYSVRKICLFN